MQFVEEDALAFDFRNLNVKAPPLLHHLKDYMGVGGIFAMYNFAKTFSFFLVFRVKSSSNSTKFRSFYDSLSKSFIDNHGRCA